MRTTTKPRRSGNKRSATLAISGKATVSSEVVLTSKELVEKKRALELRQCVKREREHANSLLSFAASEPARLSRRKRVPPEAYEAVSDPKVHVAYKELRATLALQSRLCH